MCSARSRDDLVAQIVHQIRQIPRLPATWESLVIVFTVQGRYASNFGYAFTGDGPADWVAFSNRADELDDAVVRLRDELLRSGGDAFGQVLFRLERDSGQVSFDFAYQQARWVVTPANLDELIASLRRWAPTARP